MELREYKYKSLDEFKNSLSESINQLGLKDYSLEFWNKDRSFQALEKSWNHDYSEKGINHYFRNYWINSIIHETGISIYNHIYSESGKKFTRKDQDTARKKASEFESNFLDNILENK